MSEETTVEETKKVGKVDKFFGITASGSTYKKEVVAGLTTFMSMVYILLVNSTAFYTYNGVASYQAIYIATAIGAIAGTLLMAFLAKMPLAQASGLGVNYTVAGLAAGAAGLNYGNALLFVLLDGIIFILLTATGLRKKIFEAIPTAVRKAIGVGIGMFIAFIGFQNSGLVVDGSTLVSLVSFNALGKTAFFAYAGGTVGGMVPALVVLVGVIAIAIMDKKKVKGSILWGILGSAVLFYILAALSLIGSTNAAATSFFEGITISNPFTAFAEWGEKSAFIVFRQGFDFSGYTDGVGSLIVTLITTALSLCMIDMFDTIGTLYGACRQGDLLDENGTPIRMNKMLLADAIATCVGAFAGTSTVTTFVESSTGVAAGGRTGFTALVVAIGFFVAMFLSPIAELIPSCATATALVWVGVLMMKSVADIDWQDPAEAIVSFLTIAVMAFGYSISKGIGIGIIASVIVKICTGKVKEVSVATWIIAVLYVAMFVLSD